MTRNAIREHGSLAGAFRATCASIATELETIERACSRETDDNGGHVEGNGINPENHQNAATEGDRSGE